MLARLKVRTKLIAILLPLLLGLGVLATFGVLDRLEGRGAAQRSLTFIETAEAAADLVDQLQTERLLSVALQNGDAAAAARVDAAKPDTDGAMARLTARIQDLAALDAPVGNQRAPQVATQLDQRVRAVDGAREVYDPVAGSAAAVSDAYSSIITGLDASATQLMAAAENLGGGAPRLNWLSAVKEADARTAADVTTVIAATQRGQLADAAWAVDEVKGLRADAANATKVFTTDTDEAGRTAFDAVLRDPGFIASQAPFNALSQLGPDTGLDTPVGPWLDTSLARLSALREAESGLFERARQAAAIRADELEREVRLYLGGTATALLLALLLAASVTRSITSSLGRLTDAARTISSQQLPKLVESLRHPEVEQEFTITDIDLRSEDEFAELAAAFNAVEQTALDVAAEQVATLRKGISDIFVNLARRNQSLLDRQIEFIDRLEANEEDPDQLENLFKLDHLATRMRRNAESLLVLAGAEAPRRRAKEVSLTDVIRVAVGEVEDFARITLLAVDEADAVGSAAVDVAHLLSELMENGTQYSPPDRRVEVVGHRTNDGGYVVSVSDQGVGMGPEALIEANRQLARPPVVGLSLSRSLGFIVVATLAHRHGIQVRLTDSPSGGVTALVTLPPSLLVAPRAEAPVATDAPPAPLPTLDLADEAAFDPPAFDLDAELTWAPDPPAFAEEMPPIGGPGILDPVFGIAPPESTVVPEADLVPGPSPDLAPDLAPDPQVEAAPPETSPVPAAEMGAAFEQGLYALLDHPDGQPAGHGVTQGPPPVAPPTFDPPAGPRTAPSPVASGSRPLLSTDQVAPALPTRPTSAPPLPRRVPREVEPAGTATASAVVEPERIGTPSRPPEEIRSILSRYRSGLQSGRDEGGEDGAGGVGDAAPAANSEHPEESHP